MLLVVYVTVVDTGLWRQPRNIRKQRNLNSHLIYALKLMHTKSTNQALKSKESSCKHGRAFWREFANTLEKWQPNIPKQVLLLLVYGKLFT